MSAGEPTHFAWIRSFFSQEIAFNRFLGFRLTKLDEGYAEAEVAFREELVGDPFRPALHGGVVSAAIDTAGGAAAFTTVRPPADTLSTLDMRVDYLRPARLDTLAMIAEVMRVGQRVATVDIRCFHYHAPAELIATGKAVYSIRREIRGT